MKERYEEFWDEEDLFEQRILMIVDGILTPTEAAILYEWDERG